MRVVMGIAVVALSAVLGGASALVAPVAGEPSSAEAVITVAQHGNLDPRPGNGSGDEDSDEADDPRDDSSGGATCCFG